jgi:hypothetical protein
MGVSQRWGIARRARRSAAPAPLLPGAGLRGGHALRAAGQCRSLLLQARSYHRRAAMHPGRPSAGRLMRGVHGRRDLHGVRRRTLLSAAVSRSAVASPRSRCQACPAGVSGRSRSTTRSGAAVPQSVAIITASFVLDRGTSGSACAGPRRHAAEAPVPRARRRGTTPPGPGSVNTSSLPGAGRIVTLTTEGIPFFKRGYRLVRRLIGCSQPTSSAGGLLARGVSAVAGSGGGRRVSTRTGMSAGAARATGHRRRRREGPCPRWK